MMDWAHPEIIASIIGVGLGGIGTSIFWMLNKSENGSPKNGRSEISKAIVTYDDLTRHCGAQQAMRDKSLESMLTPIKERLERGDERFVALQKEIHQNHIDVLTAIKEN